MYTPISATYANEDHTAVIMMTEEAGAVVVSERDRPELWAKLAGMTVAAYTPPIVAAPVKIADPDVTALSAKIDTLQAQIDALVAANGLVKP